jgi:hypothetical protein
MITERSKPTNQAETQKQENIWQEILNSAMLKKDLEESNVFFFGDKFSGKRTLIKMINKELLQKGEYEGKLKIKIEYLKQNKERSCTQTTLWLSMVCWNIHT